MVISMLVSMVMSMVMSMVVSMVMVVDGGVDGDGGGGGGDVNGDGGVDGDVFAVSGVCSLCGGNVCFPNAHPRLGFGVRTLECGYVNSQSNSIESKVKLEI